MTVEKAQRVWLRCLPWGAAAFVSAVTAIKLTAWPVRLDVFDPVWNRGPVGGLLESLSGVIGVWPTVIVSGVSIGAVVAFFVLRDETASNVGETS